MTLLLMFQGGAAAVPAAGTFSGRGQLLLLGVGLLRVLVFTSLVVLVK